MHAIAVAAGWLHWCSCCGRFALNCVGNPVFRSAFKLGGVKRSGEKAFFAKKKKKLHRFACDEEWLEWRSTLPSPWLVLFLAMGCATSRSLELFTDVSSCGRRRSTSTNTSYGVAGSWTFSMGRCKPLGRMGGAVPASRYASSSLSSSSCFARWRLEGTCATEWSHNLFWRILSCIVSAP